LRRIKREAEDYAASVLGRTVPEGGTGAEAQLLTIGPDVMVFGTILRTAAGRWTVRLGRYVIGDEPTLRRFSDGFALRASADCFVCFHADGEGRLLVDAPQIDTSGTDAILELHVAAPMPAEEARAQFDANALGGDMAMDLTGDEPDLDPTGREVRGAESVAQILMICLSTCKGGHEHASAAGSRIAEWNEALPAEHLTKVIALEIARLAVAPYHDTWTGKDEPVLGFVARVRGVRLLETTSDEFLKVSLSLDVHGLKGTQEYVVPISTSTRALGPRPELPSMTLALPRR
jgi:hypothetical protein